MPSTLQEFLDRAENEMCGKDHKKKKKKKIDEGTWSLPKTKEDIKKAKKAIKTLEQLQKSIYNVIGDDELFDHLDGAIRRINELLRAKKDK